MMMKAHLERPLGAKRQNAVGSLSANDEIMRGEVKLVSIPMNYVRE